MSHQLDELDLRGYLLERSGLRGLEILEPSELARAAQLFYRDGFVVIRDILSASQLSILRAGVDQAVQEITVLDPGHRGNRGEKRYSFGGSSHTRSQLHRPAWQMLLEVEPVHEILDVIFGSQNYALRAASGDFCLPGATSYQRLHSDVRDWQSEETTPFSAFHDPTGRVSIRDLPCPYICVNFLPQDVHALNGPTRQIPGTQHSRLPIPGLKDEPDWMRLSTVCPVAAGSIMIRDVRAWHGGTPNLSTEVRAIPNLEFYAPWFREPMVPGISHEDWQGLSARAQSLARFCVAEPGVTLNTQTTLRAP
ncbi:MAG: phytanoyl-CoA dioxygenase family protein [Pseudomonadales bacterium]